MTNYESLPLGELGKIVTGKTPKTENPENFGTDYMFIGPTDLHKHFFITSSERMISAKGLESIKGSALDGVSVLVGCIGWDMGNVGVVEGKCATNQQINSITNIHGKYNPLYIYYWLKTKKDFLYQQASVTRTPILNKTDFSSIRINLPKERKYQDKVVGLLAAIDQKIELNNRINAELEAMAKTLYDYWFVQFDFPDDSPQGQGKPYKTSGGKMVYNPTLKREIPEGWKDKPLSEITPVSNQSVNPADYPDQVFRHYSIPVYDATKTYGLEAGDTIGSNKFTVEESDILVSKLNPWFRRVIYAMEEEDIICSTEFVVWRTPNDSIKNFLYMVATSPQFVAHCTQSATGTSNSHKRVNSGVMMRFEIPFDEKVANALGDKLEPIVKQMIINQRESTELAKLRDWLLPMLMNGQVTVS
jgi:type I restriction enzyme S subunit